MSQNGYFFSSFSEIHKLKMHTLKMFWDTMGCTEKHRDLSEGAREDMGDIERYWDIRESVRDIMRLAPLQVFRPNCCGASPRGHWPT
jgi:hypothetical protein